MSDTAGGASEPVPPETYRPSAAMDRLVPVAVVLVAAAGLVFLALLYLGVFDPGQTAGCSSQQTTSGATVCSR